MDLRGGGGFSSGDWYDIFFIEDDEVVCEIWEH